MATINDLPMMTVEVPQSLARKGRWVDNGPLSNYARGDVVVRYRSVATQHVEPAYVAAKNPDALVPDPRDPSNSIPFHERVAMADPTKVKALGKPKARGGLIDPRPDWEEVCLSAMWSFLVQKFAPGTKEHEWLVGTDGSLIEFTNWGDQRWGVSFRDGDRIAKGRNALGLSLELLRKTMVMGDSPEIPDEEDWAQFQIRLIGEILAHLQCRPTSLPERSEPVERQFNLF
jgi:predicted NAD-dependent protein-ADP-ribosyltransferase YbiA (DUF1768 family)